MTNKKDEKKYPISLSDDLFATSTNSGDFFKKLRKFMELTQADAGRLVGVSASTWQRFEYGQFSVFRERDEVIERLSKVLDVDEGKFSKYLHRLDGSDKTLFAKLPNPKTVERLSGLANQDLFGLIEELAEVMKNPVECVKAKEQASLQEGFVFKITSPYTTKSSEDEDILAKHLKKCGWKLKRLTRWAKTGHAPDIKTKEEWVTTLTLVPLSKVDA